MEIIKKYWQFVAIVVLAILLFNKCQKEKVVKHDTPTYTTVTSKKNALKVIYVHDTIIKKFTDIKTITKNVQTVKVDTIKIIYKDSIPCVFERTGEVKTKEYAFGYKIGNKALKLDKLTFYDTLTIVDGSKRKWFLGKETNAVDVSHSNKYFYNSEVQHVEVVKKKRFYDTTVFKFGVGFLGGILIAR